MSSDDLESMTLHFDSDWDEYDVEPRLTWRHVLPPFDSSPISTSYHDGWLDLNYCWGVDCQTLSQLNNRSNRLLSNHPIDEVIIDYLNLSTWDVVVPTQINQRLKLRISYADAHNTWIELVYRFQAISAKLNAIWWWRHELQYLYCPTANLSIINCLRLVAR